MLTFFRNGGVSMFFILAFGLIALGAAGWYAVRAEKRTLGFIYGMSAATLFSVLSGTASDFGATWFYVSRMIEKEGPTSSWQMPLFEGLAESMSPPVMGFSILALVAMLVAVGRRRMDAKAA